MGKHTVITIFVRHSAGCKYTNNELSKRCDCRKHFRWTVDGEQFRQAAGTRSWAEAEALKRKLEDQLSGAPAPVVDEKKYLSEAIDAFLAEKKVTGVTHGILRRYALELQRLLGFCSASGVYHVQGLTRELLTAFCATWPSFYESSASRFSMRTRIMGFIKFAHESDWLRTRLPLPKMEIDEPPTLPLTNDEFARLLKACDTLPERGAQCRALFLLMRWSGLAIRDALTITRAEFIHDAAQGIYRIVTKRQKTGTDVSVPIRAAIAGEILSIKSSNPLYVFWPGTGDPASYAVHFSDRCVNKAFKAAGIVCQGHMKSHRLRDTFACDLLAKGVPMGEVSKLLGHESIVTTEKHYAKWVPGRQERLESLVMATWVA